MHGPSGARRPTLLMLAACYSAWTLALFALPQVSLALAILVAGVAIALHASLQHEAIHGNPFPRQWQNDLAVAPALSLVVPYARFRATHLAHHRDAHLTDPYDDPESHYLDPVRWQSLPRPLKGVLRANNTLLGRIVLGPVIGTVGFVLNEMRAQQSGDRRVLAGWLLHLPAVACVVGVVGLSPLPLWAYGGAAYLGLGLLKIRTFLEHRAHEAARARTVIVEDAGPLAWLFLNNNYHVVHHMHPGVPWHQLPALYRANRARYLAVNDGYVYRSYGEVFARYLLTGKDPVAHPLMDAPDAQSEKCDAVFGQNCA
ncbi:MAG: fatty acid desaturase [Pseudomonadota bacterium]